MHLSITQGHKVDKQTKKQKIFFPKCAAQNVEQWRKKESSTNSLKNSEHISLILSVNLPYTINNERYCAILELCTLS